MEAQQGGVALVPAYLTGLPTNMASPFTTNPFEQQTQSFLQRMEREKAQRQSALLGAIQARRKAREQQKLEDEQARINARAFSVQQEQAALGQPTAEFVPSKPPSPPISYKGLDLRPTPERKGPEFGTYLGSGILENTAEAGLTALGALEPVLQTAIGLAARTLVDKPLGIRIGGGQEFDKELTKVYAEREAAGKPGGPRQFFAASAEAARRARSGERFSEILAAGAIPLFGKNEEEGINFFGDEVNLKEFQDRREKYFKEETGKDYDSVKWNPFYITADIRASRRAYLETDQPKYLKGSLEVFFDPFNLVPGAGWINDAKALTKVATKTYSISTKVPGAIMALPSAPGAFGQGLERMARTWKAADDIPPEQITPEIISGKQAISDESARYINAWADEFDVSLTELFGENGLEIALAELGHRTSKEVSGAYDLIETVKTAAGDTVGTWKDFAGPPIYAVGRVDDEIAQGAKYLEDTSNGAKKQRTADNLNNQAEAYIKGSQASKVQEYIRSSYTWLSEKGFENVLKPINTVANAISPRLLANLRTPSVQIERLKHAFISANLQHRAAISVEKIKAVSGTSKQIFGGAIKDSIITPRAADLAIIRTKLSSHYKKVSGKLTEGVEIGGRNTGRFHESDVVNAVVEVTVKTGEDGSKHVIFDIADEFKNVKGSMFWDADAGKLTREGNYVIQRAKAYGEFARLLDESGIPLSITDAGDVIKLSGADRVRHMLNSGAFASRFVWNKTHNSVGNTAELEKYYEKARTLIDPDDLLDMVDNKRIAYASPEDTLSVYASGVYKKIADTSLEHRLIGLFKKDKALQKKYGVTLIPDLAEEASGVRIGRAGVLGGRKPEAVSYKFVDDGSGGRRLQLEDPRMDAKERLFGSLLFTDEKLAAKFANDFDVLLETKEAGWWPLFKYRTINSAPIRLVADISRIGRLAGTGIDVGLLAIYGPVILGKASADILRGLKNDDARLIQQGKGLHKALATATIDSFAAVVRRDQDAIRAMVYDRGRHDTLALMAAANITLSRQTVEAYEAVSQGGPITRWLTAPTPSLNWPGRSGLHNVLKRFEGGWSTFIDEVKISSFEAMTHHLKDPVTLQIDSARHADEIRQIGDFLNKATGTMNSEAVGLSRFQRQLETTFMFFSPRMTRSMIALLSDSMTRGDVTGQYARQGVLGAWASLQAYTWAMGQALGQDVNLDPTEPHYLQIKVGNDWIGPGSQVISIPRAAMRTIAGPDDVDAAYREFTGDGDFKDQEWFRTLKGRAFTAPAGSMLMDAITNEDYFGEPYDGFHDLAFAQSKKMLPFWAQDAVMGDPYRIGPRTVAAEFAGLRTRALTVAERRRILLDEATAEMFPNSLEYIDLDPKSRRELFAELNKEDSKLTAANDYKAIIDLIEKRREAGHIESSAIDNFYADLDDVSSRKKDDLDEAILQFESLSQQTPADLRAKSNQINKEYASEFEKLYSNTGEYQEVHNFIKRLDDLSDTERREEIWVSSYLESVLYNPEFEKVTPQGIDYYDYDGKSAIEKQWITENGIDAYNYVQNYLKAGKEIHPILNELNVMREKFSYYWEAPKQEAMNAIALDFGRSPTEVKDLWDRWNRGTSSEKELLGASEVIKAVNRYIKRARTYLRENNQGLDGFLYRFKYGGVTVPKHLGNLDEGAKAMWRSKQEIPVEMYNQFSPQQETGVK